MMKLLSAKRDPVGDVYFDGLRIIRGIKEEYSEYYLNILGNSALKALVGSKIIETKVADETLAGYSLVLEHPLISPQNYCYEWSLEMFKDAALLTLDICIELAPLSAVLKDASPWNILFRNTQPSFIDFTSIMPAEDDLLWVAYNQFVCQFLFPILIGHYTLGKTTRSLLLSSQNGINPYEVNKFLPFHAKIKYPWLVNRLYIPKLMMGLLKRTDQEKEISKFQKTANYSQQERIGFFKKLRNDISSIEVSNTGSQWSKYYDDINSFFEPNRYNVKQLEVARILQERKPKTVVDIGCNLGGYSIIAAQVGSKVIAFDTDEDSITLLYKLAKERNLDILPLVSDVLYPSPQSGWRGVEFLSSPNRFRSETAMALALIHHLAITQNQTFDRIVTTLSDYCEKQLITEFVPIEDPRSQELLLTNRRDMSWYSLEAFLDALNKEFKSVTTIPSFPIGRTLCICEK